MLPGYQDLKEPDGSSSCSGDAQLARQLAQRWDARCENIWHSMPADRQQRILAEQIEALRKADTDTFTEATRLLQHTLPLLPPKSKRGYRGACVDAAALSSSSS